MTYPQHQLLLEKELTLVMHGQKTLLLQSEKWKLLLRRVQILTCTAGLILLQ